MREILFRGFHECEDGTNKAFYNGKWHTGEWVYGYYGRKGANQTSYKHYILKSVFNSGGFSYNAIFYFEDIEVVPETVSQYTELTDKNGKKIFEDDIVRVLLSGEPAIGIVDYGKTGICAYCTMTEKAKSNYVLETDKSKIYEVIGNKFENPELLEVEE